MIESQTIEGCRIVFDYLESRRERLVAARLRRSSKTAVADTVQKNLKSKQLIALRTCNELLKRLSRAEDAGFCGRVFIFLFQSFPYGDKSSVNLRGEFHLDNVTVWDELDVPLSGASTAMEVDREEMTLAAGNAAAAGSTVPDAMNENRHPDQTSHDVKFESKIVRPAENPSEGIPLDMDTLYPVFWKLQTYFAKPTDLFQPANLHDFQVGLAATLVKFKDVQKSSESFGGLKTSETARQGTKRKRGTEGVAGNSFNSKYLTSRDLFDLEVRT